MLDILIIGSGGAGVTTALEANAHGAKVLVVSKNLPTQAQTSMAQGGINASLGNEEPDSYEEHYIDTLRSASGLANENMVNRLCQIAPKSIEWLDKMLVPFSRRDSFKTALNSIAQRKMGGSSHPRTCYAQDYTGLKILQTLYDRALESNIEFNSRLLLLDLISTEDNQVLGADFWDISEGKIKSIYAKATVVATGGFAGIYHGFSTNSYGATGDGIASVLRAGGVVEDMEFIQFHPTAMRPSSILLSEGARGAGAWIINEKGERFIDELAPRDVVSRAIFEQISNGHQIFLDLRPISKDKLQELMPQELHLARLHAKVEPFKEPIPISPASHYTMGGIAIDDKFRIKGLKRAYSVGEASSARVHGANRLGGNSLLEIIAFGRECAKEAIEESQVNKKYNTQSKAKERIESIFARGIEINHYEKRKLLGESLYKNLGIVRDKRQIEELMRILQELQRKIDKTGLRDRTLRENHDLVELIEYENSLLMAQTIAKGAMERKESRGAHFRKDYPKESPKYKKNIQIKLKGEELVFEIDN